MEIKSKLSRKVIAELKKFDWQSIIEKGNALEDLNEFQWRFMKGLVAELIVEKYSGPQGLKYVGQIHKDFEWCAQKLSVELKSQLSSSMYTQKGLLKKSFSIKLNNTNGTNQQKIPLKEQVADILIVIKNDGAFVLDQQTVIENAVATGDGFTVVVSRDQIVEITGPIKVNIAECLDIKEKISNGIRAVI